MQFPHLFARLAEWRHQGGNGKDPISAEETASKPDLSNVNVPIALWITQFTGMEIANGIAVQKLYTKTL